MASVEHDEAREERIRLQAVVDAYGPEEQAMSWYYYLGDRLTFPFQARCIAHYRSSPLQSGELVEVTAMASEDECTHAMYVQIRWLKRELVVPLAQLEAIAVDQDTQEGIADWQYWVARGYQFG